MSTYSIKIWGETVKINADFSHAGDSILIETEDGAWNSTQYQVANFRHCPSSAMAQIAYEALCVGDWDNEKENREDIESAVEDLLEYDEEIS